VAWQEDSEAESAVGAWCSPLALAGRGVHPHAPGLFVVSEADAAAIRTAFDRSGELSAAVELRRLFPRHSRCRAGAGVRSGHCRLEAATRSPAPRQAVAPTQGLRTLTYPDVGAGQWGSRR
jgi:hypothetical protein